LTSGPSSLLQIALDEQGRSVADLQVSDVIHKVYAKVDEAGTEAAAATLVAVQFKRAVARPRRASLLSLFSCWLLSFVCACLLPSGDATAGG
jgi:hypothetical protein